MQDSRKETEKTSPFGISLMISQVLYRAAQGCKTDLVLTAVHRGRSMYKGISLGKASTGRIVDWKPPGKDTPSHPAGGGSQALSASKDGKPPELAPTPSMTVIISDCYEVTI